MLRAVYSRWDQIIFNYENLFIINRWDTRSIQDFLKLNNLYFWIKNVHLQVLLMTHLLSIVISLYFYWRHNAYCEPGIYSGKETSNISEYF